MNNHIILISYYWPPDNSSGVQRWAYFAHYLKKSGYKITVITVDPKKASYKNTDESFTKLVAGINIVHTDTLEPLKAYSLITTGSAHKGIPRGGVDTSKSLFKRIASFVKENIFIPDARVGWNKYALKAAKTIIEQDYPGIIITTGPPQSTHLVGLSLKKSYPTIKWLADFRDPWIELYSNDMNVKYNWAQSKNKLLESNVLTTADSILTIGPSMQKLLQTKLPQNKRSKVSYIYNGFDQKKLADTKFMPADKFTITFVGLMASDYNYHSFITALKLLQLEPNKCRLSLAGNIAQNFLDEVRHIENLEVDFKGFVPHTKSLSMMKSASLLFTILPSQPNDKIIVSGKLMEYIASEKPILCIGNKKGDAANLLNTLEAGKTFYPQDTEGIYEFLQDCMSSKYNRNNITQETHKYSREHTASRLSELIFKLQ